MNSPPRAVKKALGPGLVVRSLPWPEEALAMWPEEIEFLRRFKRKAQADKLADKLTKLRELVES